MPPAAPSVDAYIAAFPAATQEVLQELRRRIHAALPDYVAGWARHVSVYPIPEGDPKLDADLAPYLSGRGTIRLPLSRPVPWDLVDRAIAAQVATRLPQIRA